MLYYLNGSRACEVVVFFCTPSSALRMNVGVSRHSLSRWRISGVPPVCSKREAVFTTSSVLQAFVDHPCLMGPDQTRNKGCVEVVGFTLKWLYHLERPGSGCRGSHLDKPDGLMSLSRNRSGEEENHRGKTQPRSKR